MAQKARRKKIAKVKCAKCGSVIKIEVPAGKEVSLPGYSKEG